jgi:hypothetical protein
VEGAASKPNPGYGWAVGEAWGYRRVAYAGMAALLVRERGLHQVRRVRHRMQRRIGRVGFGAGRQKMAPWTRGTTFAVYVHL